MRSHHAPHFLGLIGVASLCLASAFAIPATTIPVEPPRPTPRALDGLVAGVALYPDPLLQTILVAAESPIALHRAATAGEDGGARAPAGGRFAGRIAERLPAAAESPEIQELQKNPEVLAALDQHLLVTARLGAAHRSDPVAVWQAIARVRAQIEGAAADDTDPEGAAATPLWVIAATISEGLASPDVVAEIEGVAIDADVSLNATTTPPPVVVGIGGVHPVAVQNVQVTVNPGTGTTSVDTNDGSVSVAGGGGTTTVATGNGSATVTAGGGTTTVQTPYGTVTGTGAAIFGTAQVGDTTYGGVAGAGTVTGPNGTTVNGGGYAKGSVTQTGDASSWDTSAGGAIASSTGGYAAGTREGSGSATRNDDGSVNFDRSSSGQVQSSQGNGSFEHEGSATVTGDGNGSYEGSTTVKTDQGNLSTNTSAGDGKFSTSVDTPNGTFSQGNAKSGTPSTAPSTTSGSRTSAASPASASNRGLGNRAPDAGGIPTASRFGGTGAPEPRGTTGATGATGASRLGGSSPSSGAPAGSRFPAASTPSPTSRAPKSSSLDFQGMSHSQIHQANQSLNQSWGSLEHKMKASPSSTGGRSGSSSPGGSMNRPAPKAPKPSKPSAGGRGGRGH